MRLGLFGVIGCMYWLIGLFAGVGMLIDGHTLLEVFRVPLVGMSFLFTVIFGLMFIICAIGAWFSQCVGGGKA